MLFCRERLRTPASWGNIVYPAVFRGQTDREKGKRKVKGPPAARASESDDRGRFRDTIKHLVQRLETIVEPEKEDAGGDVCAVRVGQGTDGTEK